MQPNADHGLTCVVADDHPVVADAISSVLGAHGIEISGIAHTGDEALALIATHHPFVALIDYGLPGLEGPEIARRARRVSPETNVIVFTGRSELAVLREALDAGARGFVVKDAPLPDLVRAIELVSEGGLYLDGGLAGLLIERDDTDKLTAREREVLRLAADGLGNIQIGERLFVSPQTVRTHLGKAMAKLDAGSRTQAVAVALRGKLIA